MNIRGVVHGVAAAYPLMVRRLDSGQIVNTASMGGLMAAGLITSYVMTKHAVVGLSLALRSEAADKGVGVTVVCPSAVETPILEKGHLGKFHGRDFYLKGQGVRHPLDPDVFAAQVLEAVADDRAMLVTPRTARIAWRLGRSSRLRAALVDQVRREAAQVAAASARAIVVPARRRGRLLLSEMCRWSRCRSVFEHFLRVSQLDER